MSITYKEYNEKYRLPEQAKDEELLMKNKHHVLCYEPGKGKSYPVIHCILEVNKLKQGKAKVLIMSDATCIKNMWKAEIIPQKILPKETYMVTDRTAIGKVKEAILSTKWDIIVCDECQSLRSGVTRAKSKYAKLVYQLTKNTEYVWGMTGTIAGNNTIEPFCVLHNLNVGNCGQISCYKFKERYCVQELCWGPFGAFQKPTKLNELGEDFMNSRYNTYCSFWDYDDNDEMPQMDIQFKSFDVPITKTYEDALNGIIKCDETENTLIKAIAIQKAQQALNGFIYYDIINEKEEKKFRKSFNITEFKNPKLNFLLEECRSKNLIVAYRFQEDEYNIRKVLNDNNIKTTTEIETFKREANLGNHIILLLQCSRGKSANIQVAQEIIYYTSDFSFIAYKQMIHRCWRRGQEKPCKVIFLCNDPGDDYHIEEKIWKALRAKQSIHDCLMSIKNKEKC